MCMPSVWDCVCVCVCVCVYVCVCLIIILFSIDKNKILIIRTINLCIAVSAPILILQLNAHLGFFFFPDFESSQLSCQFLKYQIESTNTGQLSSRFVYPRPCRVNIKVYCCITTQSVVHWKEKTTKYRNNFFLDQKELTELPQWHGVQDFFPSQE